MIEQQKMILSNAKSLYLVAVVGYTILVNVNVSLSWALQSSALDPDIPYISVDEQEMGIQDGINDKSDSQRIVGGMDASPGRFAHQVALFSKDGQFMCGGSLIALDMVVTAAHCRDYVDTAKIGLYSQYDDSTAESIPICDKVSNPEYGKSGSADDVCLLRLCQKSQLATTESSTKAKTIRLNDDPNIPTASQILTVTGWGATSEGGSLATNLQQVNVNYITPTECGTIYNNAIAQSMLCAGVLAGGKDACQGDSGGPIIVEGSNNDNDILVGIVSWGIGCARPNFPGVYTRISYELSWIIEEGCRLSKTSPCGIETSTSSSSTTTSATTATITTDTSTGGIQIPPPPPPPPLESQESSGSTTTSDYSGTSSAGYNMPTLPPTTSQPTTGIPVTPQPITERPTTASPTTVKPTTAKPTTAKPTTMKPTTTKPTTMKPSTGKPVTGKPTTTKPVTARPITAKPKTSQPISAKPVTSRPITTRPVTTKPVTAKPVTAKPTIPPKTNRPTRKPTSLAPTTASPTRVCQDWKFFYTKYGGVKRDCSWVISDPSLVIQRCQDYGEIVCPVTCGFCIPATT